MANLIIQENKRERTIPAVHGEEITIKAPCNCSDVTGVQIAGVVYPFYDAAGKPMKMGSGLFSKDNLIRVLIDTENTRATIINHAIPGVTATEVSVSTELSALLNIVKDSPNVEDAISAVNTVLPKMTGGYYVGSAFSGSGSLSKISLTFPTGFKPRFFILRRVDSASETAEIRLFHPASKYTSSSGGFTCSITWGADSITFECSNALSQTGKTYHWFALGV